MNARGVRASKQRRAHDRLVDQRDAFLAECPIRTIIAMIRESQRLKARLLRTAHAIHSNDRQSIQSVTEAITYIGVEITRSLVRAAFRSGVVEMHSMSIFDALHPKTQQAIQEAAD